jgi:hypothetical protein
MRPAPLREIVNFVAFVTAPRIIKDRDPMLRSRRPSVSSGALHPIEIVLIDMGRACRTMRFNAWDHRLEMLTVRHPSLISEFRDKCGSLLPSSRGTIMVLLGSVPVVAAVYESPMSLLWRDAGALLQTLAFAATAYQLAFCPLGILGSEVTPAIGLDTDNIQSVGIAMVGHVSADAL